MFSASSLFDGERHVVALFGLGESNLGVARLLRQRNPKIKITLRSDKPPCEALLRAISIDKVIVGEAARQNIFEEAVFLSPSIRRDEECFGKVTTSSDCELFFDLYRGQSFLVTGSDGKSTCTYLISRILSRSGFNSAPCANFGKSLCATLAEENFESKFHLPVIELSSFQLMNLAPHGRRALITNITPNHLDWHKDYEEYVSAKLNIAKNSKELVFDADCETLAERLRNASAFCAVSFNRSASELTSAYDVRHYITYSDDIIFLDGEPYADISRATRKESYNIKNYMLSLAMTLGFAEKEVFRSVFENFSGLSHRAETVCRSGGIRYVNSSIDTTPKRTLQTLLSLSGEVVVILGGKSKRLPKDELIGALPKLTRGAVLMGEFGRELREFLLRDSRYCDYPYVVAENMSDAVRLASHMLCRGGTVLLSPGATSFDSYKNFCERGEDFRACVARYTKDTF